MNGIMALAAALLILAANAGSAIAADTLAISLEESVRIALERNKDLIVAREKTSEARALVGETETAFLPQITGSAGYTRLDVAPFIPTSRFGMLGGGLLPKEIVIGLRDNYAATLRLQQPLFTGGRITKTRDIARLAGNEAESDVQRAARELVYEVKRAYLSCVKAANTERVAAESVNRFEAHLADIQTLRDAGLAADNDVLKTKVYLSESRLALMRALHAVRLARTYFCNVVDLPLASEILFTSSIEAAAPIGIDLETAVGTGLRKREELQSMEYRNRMTRKEFEMARGGYLPDVSFFANLNYLYPNREYERDFYSSWSMGVLAQMNLFDWGRTAYRIRQSRSRLRQIETAERSLRDAITLDVTETYFSLIEAWNEIEAARENVAQAEENHRVTAARFKEGLATNTEMLDAQVLLTGARTIRESAAADYLIARADLARAVGADIP
ncbi:MAG: TolC family protein [Candidatus Krumholzibacteria bacterium]|nr:TolC family protein [Candidatus Krumholzibacteria bacterium]